MIRVLFIAILALAAAWGEDTVPDISGDIVREPETGILHLPEQVDASEEDYHLKCALKEGNELVSDVQWTKYEDKEWISVPGESLGLLDVGAIYDGDKYTHEGHFRCQIGQHTADFIVFIGNRSALAKNKFKVKRFHKSYDVDEGEDFRIECEIGSRKGDVEQIKKQLEFRWFKWSETNDHSYVNVDDEGRAIKANCSVPEGTNWLEIKGDEIEEGSLEPHIQLLTNFTLKIEDATQGDRRGYKCLAYNRTDPSICSDSVFFVRVKDRYAAIWPFVGIVAEVVVLVLIIFVCEKRKAAKDALDEEEEYNGNAVGRSSENSNLRQRRS